MSDNIIRAENLSKRYVLSHQRSGRSQYELVRDVVADGGGLLLLRLCGSGEVEGCVLGAEGLGLNLTGNF